MLNFSFFDLIFILHSKQEKLETKLDISRKGHISQNSEKVDNL